MSGWTYTSTSSPAHGFLTLQLRPSPQIGREAKALLTQERSLCAHARTPQGYYVLYLAACDSEKKVEGFLGPVVGFGSFGQNSKRPTQQTRDTSGDRNRKESRTAAGRGSGAQPRRPRCRDGSSAVNIYRVWLAWPHMDDQREV